MTAAQYLFGFDGRLNRAKWWLSILILAGVGVVYTISALVVRIVSVGSAFHYDLWGEPSFSLGGGFIVLAFLGLALFIVSNWIGLAVMVKRLHDRDKSGVWALLFYLGPSLCGGFVWGFMAEHSAIMASLFGLATFGIVIWGFVELGCLPGTQGPNRFGPDPLANFYGHGVSQPGTPYGGAAQPEPVRQTGPQHKLELSGAGSFSEYFLGVEADEMGAYLQGLVIGREASSATFVIADERVSRAHARLHYSDGKFWIADAGSSNGSALNGQRLAPHERRALHSGDKVKFGPALFAVTIS